MKKIITLLLLCIVFTSSCERDDLCPEETQTTPRLIIDFIDILDDQSPKNVGSLVVRGIGNANVLEDFAGVTSDKVILPLKTTENSTQFSLYKNGKINDDGTISGNEDVINITYKREEIFVSRACGYKTIYKELNITRQVDSDNWILFTEPINDNQSVENETTSHFKILH